LRVRYGDFDWPEPAGALRGADKLMLISGTRVGARAETPRGHDAACGRHRHLRAS
jgi:NAD(P)H dehydrogenase (quinone)